MKKMFRFIGAATIISLSIIISEKTTTVVKNIDTLMNTIKQKQEEYMTPPINATIKNNTIIPGINGKKIDIQQTYNEMKKIGNFNDKYIKYQQIQPEITIENNYDKYIISGNKQNNSISIIFLLYKDTNIEKLRQILKKTNTKATFFIDAEWLEKNNEQIKELASQGHTIGNLGYNNNYQNIEYIWIDTKIKKETKQTHFYCYNKKENEENLNNCVQQKNYTIRPNITIKTNPLKEIKKQISPGSIIELPINDKTNNELELIINYIKSKGYTIKNIEEHLSEKNNN